MTEDEFFALILERRDPKLMKEKENKTPSPETKTNVKSEEVKEKKIEKKLKIKDEKEETKKSILSSKKQLGTATSSPKIKSEEGKELKLTAPKIKSEEGKELKLIAPKIKSEEGKELKLIAPKIKAEEPTKSTVSNCYYLFVCWWPILNYGVYFANLKLWDVFCQT